MEIRLLYAWSRYTSATLMYFVWFCIFDACSEWIMQLSNGRSDSCQGIHGAPLVTDAHVPRRKYRQSLSILYWILFFVAYLYLFLLRTWTWISHALRPNALEDQSWNRVTRVRISSYACLSKILYSFWSVMFVRLLLVIRTPFRIPFETHFIRICCLT